MNDEVAKVFNYYSQDGISPPTLPNTHKARLKKGFCRICEKKKRDGTPKKQMVRAVRMTGKDNTFTVYLCRKCFKNFSDKEKYKRKV